MTEERNGVASGLTARPQPGTTDNAQPSGHTPGPWGNPVWDAHSAKVLVTLTGQPFDCWASPGGSVFRDRDMADGLLIAVAPDLLAALRVAAEFIEDEADNRAAAGSEMSDYEREPRELADRLAAVIAKAEGRR